MMMIVDVAKSQVDFMDMSDSLESLGEDIGVVIKCQREEIFDSMHRL